MGVVNEVRRPCQNSCRRIYVVYEPVVSETEKEANRYVYKNPYKPGG